jgi:eukaryotic-like serine/threonine-protein kinase
MLNVGVVLQGRYRIVSHLGGGGFGDVYRAWHLSLNAPVAVKEMVPQLGLDAATLARLRAQFQQEAGILAHLDHPHLVRVTDYFEEAGNAYLVMNLVEGETLDDLITRRGVLPEAEVLVWADQLLDALAYCHGQGVIHRDVKPQNVIIRPDGRAVLVDFGLVKLWDPNDPHTRTAIRGMGTPEYAPPEQYGTQPGYTDPRSDIYSLGATLYHALTGQAPMTASDRTADPGNFKPVWALNPRVSVETQAAVLQAMALPRQGRFRDATEMRAALGKVRAAPAAPAGTLSPLRSAHSASPSAPSAERLQRKRPDIGYRVAQVAGIAILLILFVGLGLVLGRMLLDPGWTPLGQGGTLPSPTSASTPLPFPIAPGAGDT